MRTFITILFLFVSCASFTQDRSELAIGLFWNNRPQKAVFKTMGGAYKVVLGTSNSLVLDSNEFIQLAVKGSKIEVKTSSQNLGLYSQIGIIEIQDSSTMRIKSMVPKLYGRVYEDNFKVSAYKNRLKIINQVEIENYVAGVIQWEAGKDKTVEYYKVQAIITRTYALKNINKFISQGFNLCDRVESQVFKGITTNPDILRGVSETKDLVLVDGNMQLISALFHSNSGGRTQNSEDVWSQKISYLRGINDPYSIDQPHYMWNKTMPTDKWLKTFQSKFSIDTHDEETLTTLLDFCPGIAQYYFLPEAKLRSTIVRSTFKLKSTNFCVHNQNDSILIVGRGFGHGVGLSQEGAMNMAEKGIGFETILNYYYTNVHLVNLSTLDFLEAGN